MFFVFPLNHLSNLIHTINRTSWEELFLCRYYPEARPRDNTHFRLFIYLVRALRERLFAPGRLFYGTGLALRLQF